MNGEFKVNNKYVFLKLSDAVSKKNPHLLFDMLTDCGLFVDNNYMFAVLQEDGEKYQAVYYFKNNAMLRINVEMSEEEATIRWEMVTILDYIEDVKDELYHLASLLEVIRRKI